MIARALVAAAAAAGLALAGAGSTSAASQYAWVHESFNNDVCVANWSEVTTGGANNGGYTASVVNTWFNNHCSQHIPRPANSVRVRTDILAFDLDTGIWFVCWSSPYAVNVNGQYQVGTYYNINRYCNKPGEGRWYANNTLAEAKNIAGSWRGGWLASGNEWVGPAFAAAATAVKPKEPKIGIRQAIERGDVRTGSPTGPKLPRSFFEGKTAAPPALNLNPAANVPTKASATPRP
ncbi:hypothetical protein GCM10010230_25360 [Streptomyces narbonensis]|uniref:hypothetical protein n=1 Tax=Streptomyces narbonensis TaxID=67333 RepID=UPI001676EBBE|nr:hypothetical protein [Streptomyces narbonensis]GGV99379.1 hypothetical protein GCM10010230_25360 [Streptomyces narbonensis]